MEQKKSLKEEPAPSSDSVKSPGNGSEKKGNELKPKKQRKFDEPEYQSTSRPAIDSISNGDSLDECAIFEKEPKREGVPSFKTVDYVGKITYSPEDEQMDEENNSSPEGKTKSSRRPLTSPGANPLSQRKKGSGGNLEEIRRLIFEDSFRLNDGEILSEDEGVKTERNIWKEMSPPDEKKEAGDHVLILTNIGKKLENETFLHPSEFNILREAGSPLPHRPGNQKIPMNDGQQPENTGKAPSKPKLNQILYICSMTDIEVAQIYWDPFPLLAFRKKIRLLCARISALCFIIVTNPLFEFLSISVIIANCGTMIAESSVDQFDSNGNQTQVYNAISNCDNYFLLFYIVEMMLKIMAYGVILRPLSYLRDSWNILDFVIVVSSCFLFVLSGESNSGLSSLRSLKVLRPLRTISSVKPLRNLLATLFSAFPLLVDTMLILLFFFIIFAIGGVQLFAGVLKNRCVDPTTGIAHSDTSFLCGNTDCDEGYICSKLYENPFFGIRSFDSIYFAILQVFMCITLEGWTDISQAIKHTYSQFAFLYFLLIVFVGSFFLLNLTLAVIKANFTQTSKEENKVGVSKADEVRMAALRNYPFLKEHYKRNIKKRKMDERNFKRGHSIAAVYPEGLNETLPIKPLKTQESDLNAPRFLKNIQSIRPELSSKSYRASLIAKEKKKNPGSFEMVSQDSPVMVVSPMRSYGNNEIEAFSLFNQRGRENTESFGTSDFQELEFLEEIQRKVLGTQEKEKSPSHQSSQRQQPILNGFPHKKIKEETPREMFGDILIEQSEEESNESSKNEGNIFQGRESGLQTPNLGVSRQSSASVFAVSESEKSISDQKKPSDFNDPVMSPVEDAQDHFIEKNERRGSNLSQKDKKSRSPSILFSEEDSKNEYFYNSHMWLVQTGQKESLVNIFSNFGTVSTTRSPIKEFTSHNSFPEASENRENEQILQTNPTSERPFLQKKTMHFEVSEKQKALDEKMEKNAQHKKNKWEGAIESDIPILKTFNLEYLKIAVNFGSLQSYNEEMVDVFPSVVRGQLKNNKEKEKKRVFVMRYKMVDISSENGAKKKRNKIFKKSDGPGSQLKAKRIKLPSKVELRPKEAKMLELPMNKHGCDERMKAYEQEEINRVQQITPIEPNQVNKTANDKKQGASRARRQLRKAKKMMKNSLKSVKDFAVAFHYDDFKTRRKIVEKYNKIAFKMEELHFNQRVLLVFQAELFPLDYFWE